jgi:hypothetical protein
MQGKKLYFIRWMRDKWSETVDDNPREGVLIIVQIVDLIVQGAVAL